MWKHKNRNKINVLLTVTSQRDSERHDEGYLTSSILWVRHVPWVCSLKRFLIPNSSPLLLPCPCTASKYRRELSLPTTVHCSCWRREKKREKEKTPHVKSLANKFSLVNSKQDLSRRISSGFVPSWEVQKRAETWSHSSKRPQTLLLCCVTVHCDDMCTCL